MANVTIVVGKPEATEPPKDVLRVWVEPGGDGYASICCKLNDRTPQDIGWFRADRKFVVSARRARDFGITVHVND